MSKVLSALFVLFICLNGFSIEIKGTVADEFGKSIPNAPVKFVMKKTKFDIKTFENKIIDSKYVVYKTDSKGFFNFSPKIDTYFNVFVLEFTGDGFDYAKYLLPEPEDISSNISKGEQITVNRTYQTHPDWLKLQIALEGYDKKSSKYKVLRKYGFPDKRDIIENIGEKWYYFELGKEFLIK